jgi:hypothetical protein
MTKSLTRTGKQTLAPQTVNAAAVESSTAAIKKIYARMEARLKNVAQEMLGIANDALQLGFYFQEATGKTQLEFYLFEKMDVPANLPFKLARGCMAMAERYGPKHTFANVQEAAQEIKFLFQEMNLVPASKRLAAAAGASGKAPVNYWNECLAGINTLAGIFDDWEKEEPMDKWPRERIENFLLDSEPIEKRIRKATELLERR